MSLLWTLVIAVHLPAIMGLVLLALPRGAGNLRAVLAALTATTSFALLISAAISTSFVAGPVGVEWMPQFKLNAVYHADQLGLFFALLVSGIGILISLYARGYFGPDQPSLYRFYPTLLLFMTAMLGLVLADNFMLLLLYWELTSISSFLLIGWDRDDSAAVKNALQAFIVTGTGGLAMMGGLILLGLHTGAWGMDALIVRGVPLDTTSLWAFGLIFVGAAAKSAQWPLHFWLPGAMAAPTPVSAYLHSATMVKAGVYLLARIWPALAVLPLWSYLIIPIGAFTMVLGAYIALRKSDLKQIFAYTTVSQLGLFVCGYGLSRFNSAEHPTVIWDITQILNHALYKAPLFMLAGAIHHAVHTRELPELRGLARMPGHGRIPAILTILAAYAMAAGPFTLSFPSKEFFLYSTYNWYKATGSPGAIAVLGATVLAATFTVAIFIRLTRVLLAAPGNDAHAHHAEPITAHGHGHDPHGTAGAHGEHAAQGAAHHEAHDGPFWSAMLWVPALLLIALQYLGGTVPAAFAALFGPIEHSVSYFTKLPSVFYLVSHPGIPLYLSALAILLGLTLGFAPVLTRTIKDVHDKLFPGFYNLSTKGGGRVFAILQTGNLRTYLLVIFLAIIGFTGWGIRQAIIARGPDAAWVGERIHTPAELLTGSVIAIFVCVSAVLMVALRQPASRILMLGSVGFAVTAVYYIYAAPDLALTQISIEIVSLILFLLVLRSLTKSHAAQAPIIERHPYRAIRIIVALSLGGIMFLLTLMSTSVQRPPMPYLNVENEPFAAAGEFFLRNSYDAVDLPNRSGGGGNNVVNVTLVDFRGLDTLGEITVLGLAAIGVWTLLRRRNVRRETRALHRNLSDVIETTTAHAAEGSRP